MPGLYEALLGARSAQPRQPMATPPPPPLPTEEGGDPFQSPINYNSILQQRQKMIPLDIQPVGDDEAARLGLPRDFQVEPVGDEEALKQGLPPRDLDIQPVLNKASLIPAPSLYQSLAFGRKRTEPPKEEDPFQKFNKDIAPQPGNPGASALKKVFS